MFTKKQTETESMLDTEIRAALADLANVTDKSSEKYGALVDRIAKLHKLKAEEGQKPISRDTALLVAANVFGIVWTTQHERLHVIPTKAFGLILKLSR
jgi:hypothetical protein